MIKTIIYDLDDLMVNSIKLHRKANQKVLHDYDVDPGNLPETLTNKFVGRRVVDILKTFIKEFSLEVDLKNLEERREKIFLKLVRNELETMPGLEESLELFKNNNFKIAIASSGTIKYIDLVLNKFNIKNYFNVIVSGDDVKNGKPNPETFIVATEKLDTPPQNCLVLEDATNGIESAKQAGCKCVAIKNSYTPQQDLSKADKILDSLLNINMEIINSL